MQNIIFGFNFSKSYIEHLFIENEGKLFNELELSFFIDLLKKDFPIINIARKNPFIIELTSANRNVFFTDLEVLRFSEVNTSDINIDINIIWEKINKYLLSIGTKIELSSLENFGFRQKQIIKNIVKFEKISEDIVKYFLEKNIYDMETKHRYSKGIFIYSNNSNNITLGIEPLYEDPDKFIIDYDVQFNEVTDLENINKKIDKEITNFIRIVNNLEKN